MAGNQKIPSRMRTSCKRDAGSAIEVENFLSHVGCTAPRRRQCVRIYIPNADAASAV